MAISPLLCVPNTAYQAPPPVPPNFNVVAHRNLFFISARFLTPLPDGWNIAHHWDDGVRARRRQHWSWGARGGNYKHRVVVSFSLRSSSTCAIFHPSTVAFLPINALYLGAKVASKCEGMTKMMIMINHDSDGDDGYDGGHLGATTGPCWANYGTVLCVL